MNHPITLTKCVYHYLRGVDSVKSTVLFSRAEFPLDGATYFELEGVCISFGGYRFQEEGVYFSWRGWIVSKVHALFWWMIVC